MAGLRLVRSKTIRKENRDPVRMCMEQAMKRFSVKC